MVTILMFKFCAPFICVSVHAISQLTKDRTMIRNITSIIEVNRLSKIDRMINGI